MKSFIQKTIINTLFKFFCLFPIKRNRVICLNFNGKGYGESPKNIVDELLSEERNIEVYWVVKDIDDSTIPQEIKKVKYKSFNFLKILYTSKIIINDVRFGLFFSKRKNQVYIQTWHGCLPLKKIEYDVIDRLPSKYVQLMRHDSRMIDYMISNSSFYDELCKRAFLYDGKILKIGCPKNDTLINDNQVTKKESVCELYNISKEKLIVIYVPTFRNSYDSNPYDVDFKRLKDCIKNKYNKECEIFVKLHPVAIDVYRFEDDSNMILANDFNDTQQLLLASDIIITDYSSVMFEGMIANKPVVLYAKDIDEYNDERGFYFDFNELPFPLAKNNDELIDIIKNNDLNEMKKNYDSFKKKVGLVEEGVASKKVCDLITSYIDGDGNE